MPYSDYIRAIDTYGSYYNQGSNYINPYSSAGYVGSTATNAVAPVDPRSQFSDYSPSGMDRLATGAMGYQIGAGVGKAVPGIASSIAKKSFTPAITKSSGMMLTGAGLLYGATRDQNPYEYTKTERAGTIGTGAMTGAALGKYFGPSGMLAGAIIGGLGGWAMSGSQKSKAEEMNLKAETEYTEARAEYLGDIQKERKEQREYALGMTEAGQWGSEAQKYDNQYGAYANPYGTSYMDEGGVMNFHKNKGTVTVPKHWKSDPNHPETELAYITKKEKELLLDKDLHNSLKNGPNKGPAGVMSLNGSGEFDDPGGGMGGGDIYGCTDYYAANYNSQATMDDGTCVYPTPGDTGQNISDDVVAAGGSESDINPDIFLEDWEGEGMPNTMVFNPDALPFPPEPREVIQIPRIDRPVIDAGQPKALAETNKKGMKITPSFKQSGRSSADELDAYRWDLENPYIRENVDIFEDGGKLTKKEMKKVQGLGRRGDTELAHVNPQEKAMLKYMGGSGRTNPLTGLPEYHYDWSWGGANSHNWGHVEDSFPSTTDAPWLIKPFVGVMEGISNVGDWITQLGQNRDDKTATYNEETGGWEMGTSQEGMTLGFDPTGQTAGSAQLHLETPTGVGGAQTGQAIYGDPWAVAPEGQSLPRIDRGTITTKGGAKKDSKVVNPFKSGANIAGEEQMSASGLDKYRWDLENPYIRENVDIFDDGGVVNEPESLPMDSMLNRQLFTESSFNPSAESPKGALGLSQITKDTFNDMIGWGWVPEGKKFSDLKTDTNLSVNLQKKYMSDLMSREWNKGSEEVVKAKALAAYNMGPTGLVNKLNKLKADGKDIYNNLDWLNSLSKETRNYVNKIMKGGGEKFESEYTEAWKSGGKDYDEGGKVSEITNDPTFKAWYVSNAKRPDVIATTDTQELLQLFLTDIKMNQIPLFSNEIDKHGNIDKSKRPLDLSLKMLENPTYKTGGIVDTVAEFTGNELIVNNQNEVEAGLAANDFKRAAAPIREAMNKGYLTPGSETHQGNPMPVSGQGVIYAGGGELPFKVRQGAGIYDHATDQFNLKMSDKQIAMVAKKNMNKWEKNNMN